MKKILSSVLILTMLLSVAAFSTTSVYANESAAVNKYKPLDISNGANSRLFIPAEGAGNYTPFVDYFEPVSSPITASFDEGALTSSAYAATARGLKLGVSGGYGTFSNISADGKWNDSVTGVPYEVDLDGKQIKLYQYTAATDATAEQKAVLEQAKTATIDVENGIYTKLWMMTTDPSNISNRFKPTVIYTDGTSEELAESAWSSKWNGNVGGQWKLTNSTGTADAATYFAGIYVTPDTDKIVDKIKLELTNAWGYLLIPAITAEIATPDEVVAGMSAADTVTDETVADVKTQLAFLDGAFAAYNQTETNLTEENQTKLAAIKEKVTSLQNAVLSQTSNISLSIQDGAKSKLFLAKDSTDSNFVAYQDYAANQISTSEPMTPAEYKTEAYHLLSTVSSTVDSGGITYQVDTSGKAIVLRKYTVDITGSDVTEAEKEAAAAMDTAEINLANDAYSKLHFLAYTSLTVPAEGVAAPEITVYYTDGSTETKLLAMTRPIDTNNNVVLNAPLYKMGATNDNIWSKFGSYSVELTYSHKVVDKIGIKGTGNLFYWQMIIGMAATKTSAADLISELNAEIEDDVDYRTQKELLSAVKARLSEINVAESELSAENQAKLTAVNNAVSAYEANAEVSCSSVAFSASEVPAKNGTIDVTANFYSPVAKSAVMLVAEYADEELLKVKIYPQNIAAGDSSKTVTHTVETDADELRAFVWDSLNSLKPLVGIESIPKKK